MSNKFQQATPQGQKHTVSDIWLTPEWIINSIGISDLDPCGWKPNGSPIVETAKNYYTEDENGLNKDWYKYTSVFCNPPYSDLKNWLKKCHETHSIYGTNIIVLCFVRSETQAFQNNIKGCTGINLISKRIKFLNYLGEEKGNGNAPSCLIAWGGDAYKRIRNVKGLYFKKDYQ